MHYFIGFVIALFIALTGVGAGTVTVPILVLFLKVPAPAAVGIGLIFSAAIKSILTPAQIIRRNVAWRTLGFMLLGGAPGVLIGSLLLRHLATAGSQNLVNALLGAILVSTASWQILCFFRPMKQNAHSRDRSLLLPWLMLPVGAEVGFSSAGAGALGSAALLSLTPLMPAEVAGTDIVFGFTVSLIGGGAHWLSHAFNPQLLLQLIAGGVGGAIAGTVLGTRIPHRPLRFALWVWLLVLGGQFLFNSYQVWASPGKTATYPFHTIQLKQR
jgi:uncharacterized membrane protein YfcA